MIKASRWALVFFVIGFLFMRPMCHCPGHYAILALFALVSVVCGPALYRWIGGAALALALGVTVQEYSAEKKARLDFQRLEQEARARNNSN